MATPNPTQPNMPDYYHVLGVNFNASSEEVSRAFRQKARQIHPDKQTSRNVNDWHTLHKAYTTLMNDIKRKDYNEKLASQSNDSEPDYDKLALPTTVIFSESFKKSFKQWMNECIPNTNFRQSFDSNLQMKLNECHIPPCEKRRDLVRTGRRKIETNNIYLEDVISLIAREVKEFASESAIKDATQHIARIIKVAQTSQSCSLSIHLAAPIIDFSGNPVNDLVFMLRLFNSQEVSSQNQAEIQKCLAVFVPIARVHKNLYFEACQSRNKCSRCGSTKKVNFKCASCEQKFCYKCPLASRKAPRIGIHVPQPVCQNCTSKLNLRDAEDWITKAMALLEEESNQMAAMTCILIALILTDDLPISDMRAVSNKLAKQGQPEQALIILSLLNEVSHKYDAKLHVSLMKILQQIGNKQGKSWREKWFLTLLAQQSLMQAELSMSSSRSKIDIPNISTARQAIITSIHSVECEKSEEYKSLVDASLCELEKAWMSRDLKEMMNIITKHEVIQVDALIPHNGIEPTIKALEIFLKSKCDFLLLMQSDDQCALNFFQGFLHICNNAFRKGFKCFEEAVWSGLHNQWLSETIIPLVIMHVNYHPSMLRGIERIGEEILLTPQTNPLCFDALFHVLGIMQEDLNPSLKSAWPLLTVPGINQAGTRKFEQNIIQQVKEGKLSYTEAGYNLINFFPSACHPSETAVCFLNASLWFLKEMYTTQKGKQYMYALKKIVLELVQWAYQGTAHALHPGMQFYVSRYGLAIVVKAISVNPKCATAEDTEIILTLFKSVIDKGRYNPFWKMPIVPICEALLLNIISGRMHTEFMLQLQKQKPNCLLKNEELQYQIYENDLRWTCQVENKEETRERAMEVLLNEEGLSWSDISNTMSSILSPRTPDGWLIQQGQLQGDLPFLSLTGFVIDTDTNNPSIKMSAIPRQRHQNGLFSGADVKAVVNVPKDKLFPIFFSLDPPDDSKRFHPFQKLRFEPACLENTDLLHTLLQTDYLMKCFSVGSDVSSIPPFNQRDCSEGLTAKLPPHMKKILAPVSERGEVYRNKTSRFWIQADEIEYNVTNDGTKVRCRIGAVKMVVRTSPQLPGLDGKLFDVEDDDPNSPEAQFAKDLTDNYDEISKYFPMFGRLRELCKLQILGIILDGIKTNIADRAEGKGITIPKQLLQEIQEEARIQFDSDIEENLRKIRQDVGVWPAADDYNEFQTHYRRFKDMFQSQYPYQTLSYEDEQEMKRLVKKALNEKDEKTVDEITRAFQESLRGKSYRGNLRSCVRSYLSYGSPDLKNLIVSTMQLPTEQDIKRMIMIHAKEELDTLKHTVNKISLKMGQVKGRKTCTWVPAAIKVEEREESMRMCYGGVLLAPKFQETSSIPRKRDEKYFEIQTLPTPCHGVHQKHQHSAPSGYTIRKGLTLCSLTNPFENPQPLEIESTTLKIVKLSITAGANNVLQRLHQLLGSGSTSGHSLGPRGNSRLGSRGAERSGCVSSGSQASGAAAAGGGGRRGGFGGGGGGGGGDGGDGGDKGKRWLTALLLLLPLLPDNLLAQREKYEKVSRKNFIRSPPALRKLMNDMIPKTAVLRDEGQARKFREKEKREGKLVDSSKHAAHIVGLELVKHVLIEIEGCEINKQDLEQIRESCNKFENFELVDRNINWEDHRHVDKQLKNAIDEYLDHGHISRDIWKNLTADSSTKERVRNILDYFKQEFDHEAITQRVQIFRNIKNPDNPSQNLWDI